MADDLSKQTGDASLPPEIIRHADGNIEHPRVRRERQDVGFRPVLAFVVVSLLIGGAQLALVWRLFRQAEPRAETLDEAREPLSAQPVALPPEPRLEQLDRIQGIESGNVRWLQLKDLQELDRFGRTSDAGYVHIPIRDAMDLVVGTLPIRAEDQAGRYRSRGLVNSGESNSGRMFRGTQ